MNEEQEYLKQYHLEDYERPSVAADIAVFTIMEDKNQEEPVRKLSQKKLKILMIRRGQQPHKNHWALPGGFLKKGETIYDTARRELKEETGRDQAYLELCHVFSEQDRDPRGWIISQAFMALMDSQGENTVLHPGSDAAGADWFDLTLSLLEEKTTPKPDDEVVYDRIYELILSNGEETLSARIAEHKIFRDYHEKTKYEILSSGGIAFDHAKIITCVLKKLRKNVEINIKNIFDLMPEYFTLTDVQTAAEIVLDQKLLKPNFRRKIQEYVTKTDKMMIDGGHRPSILYRRNISAFYQKSEGLPT